MNEYAVKMSTDYHTCTRLLDMVARKLGHDFLRLFYVNQQYTAKKWYCNVAFGQHRNYDTDLLEANGKPVLLKHVDAKGHFRSNCDMYNALTKRLYKTLKRGGKLSDGKNEVDASAVPEFMIECVLNGVAE